MVTLKISRRYAKALLTAAVQHSITPNVAADLELLVRLGDSSRDLRSMLRSPVISADVKKNVLTQVLGATVNPLTISFLSLVIDKGRENLWRELALEYQALLDVRNNIKRVSIASSVELDEEQRHKLETSLAARLSSTIAATYSVDPAILGGAIVRVGDQVLDGSLRHQLVALKSRLAGV